MEVATAPVAARAGRSRAVLGWTLIWSGLFIFGYLGWQLFVTDLLNARVQASAVVELDVTLEEAREDPPPVEEVEVDEGVVVDFFPEEAPPEDEEFAMIRIPTLGLEAVVFEGVGLD
ncbi:MAG TPA: hypothetical protein VFZ15_03390, partial [Acidimicrobiia bacterium]|nr:hypothetical protein [Acidimicrobiia bacterium]